MSQDRSQRSRKGAPKEVWVAKGRVSGYWEFVVTQAPDPKHAAEWHHYVLAETSLSETATPEGWKLVCEQCGCDQSEGCGWPMDCPVGKGIPMDSTDAKS